MSGNPVIQIYAATSLDKIKFSSNISRRSAKLRWR
jgi:hypothetical protein